MTSTTIAYGPAQALVAADHIRTQGVLPGLTAADLTPEVISLIPLPKGVSSSTTLVRSSKKYIVPFNGKFYSYPLMLVPHPTGKDLFKMMAPIPNILREGMVVVDAEIYFVTLEDLKRGIVRKSRHLPIPAKRTITYEDFINGHACTQISDLPDEHYYSTKSINERRQALDRATGGSSSGTTSAQGREGDESHGAQSASELDEESRLADLAYQEQVGSLYGFEDPETQW